uniref:Uncharacterized protein n=1 Tax=Timema cristinae TaxID=61476 RepID=A0A7R9CKM9_TIMCR|nr:unnamed protein product [Timema cristinae]
MEGEANPSPPLESPLAVAMAATRQCEQVKRDRTLHDSWRYLDADKHALVFTRDRGVSLDLSGLTVMGRSRSRSQMSILSLIPAQVTRAPFPLSPIYFHQAIVSQTTRATNRACLRQYWPGMSQPAWQCLEELYIAAIRRKRGGPVGKSQYIYRTPSFVGFQRYEMVSKGPPAGALRHIGGNPTFFKE